MKHFLPFTGKIADYYTTHYDELKSEFIEHVMPMNKADKPKYTRHTGELLYDGRIDVVAFKLTKTLLDVNELRLTRWTDTHGLYRYPFKNRYPEVYDKLIRWQDFINTFDDTLEQCFFNIAYPKANLSYHYGVSNHAWRAHICFQTNPGFIFNIEGDKKKWEEGMDNSFMFDDGNLSHGVDYEEMNVEQPRIVSILDIKK
jgi:hypothetical protein